MANLSFNEKQLIESVFGMNSGYVLDFLNREFEAFMLDVVPYNVYERYRGLSKAKILREIIKNEPDPYVGKTIMMLISYMSDKGLMIDAKKEKAGKLIELGTRLLGKSIQNKPIQADVIQQVNSKVDFDNLNKLLLAIENISNRQTKGYAFEKYLNNLFKAFELDPHASYRTEYDQIDGSFILEGSTILIEAKYKANAIPKDDLILFSNKIQEKSHFTKGLFITYSPVEEKAIEYFNNKSARIVILTVEELFIMCQYKYSLKEILHAKYRTLDERGIIFKHIMTLM